MAPFSVFATLNALVGSRHTERVLGDLPPHVRADIGVDRYAPVRYPGRGYHRPTQRWLDSLR